MCLDDLQQRPRAGCADVRCDLLLPGAEAELPRAAAALEPRDGPGVDGQLVQDPSRLTHVPGIEHAPELLAQLLDLLEVAIDR
jgi:hypothetical protein